MPEVLRAFEELKRLGIDLWSVDAEGRRRCPLFVDASGHVVIETKSTLLHAPAQPFLPSNSMTDILQSFEAGQIGKREAPDLAVPRPHLRIVPGKVSGEAHVADTRLTTPTLAALADRGMPIDTICRLYPDVPRVAVEEAIDLENKLAA